MVWMEWTGVPGALGVATNVWANRGGWREGLSAAMGGDDEEGGKQGSYQILGHPVPFWDKTGVGRILRNWQL